MIWIHNPLTDPDLEKFYGFYTGLVWIRIRNLGVRTQLVEIAPDYIRLSTEQEKATTAAYILRKHHLPNFAYGVDGMIIRFAGAPRDIPVGPGLATVNQFYTRKGCYGINALIVGNERKLINAVDIDWHGSAHDARIWNSSLIKPIIEEDRQYCVAADAAFPISDILIKPFSIPEARDDARKRLFNRRLSGIVVIVIVAGIIYLLVCLGLIYELFCNTEE